MFAAVQAQDEPTYTDAGTVAVPASVFRPDLVVTHVSVQHAPNRGQVQFAVQDRFGGPFEGLDTVFQWELRDWRGVTVLDSGEARLKRTETLPARSATSSVIRNAVLIVTDHDVARIFQGTTAQTLRFIVNPSRSFEEAYYTNNELVANLGVPCDLPDGCSNVTADTRLEGIWVVADAPGVIWLDVRYTIHEAYAGTEPDIEIGPRRPFSFSFRLPGGVQSNNEVQCVTGRAWRGVTVGHSRVARHLCSFSKQRAEFRPEVSEWTTDDVSVSMDDSLTGTNNPRHVLTLPFRKDWMEGLEEDFGTVPLPDLRLMTVEFPNARSWTGSRDLNIVVANMGTQMSREAGLRITLPTESGQRFKSIVTVPRISLGESVTVSVPVPGTDPAGGVRRFRCEPYTANLEVDFAGEILESHEAPWVEGSDNNTATARMESC
jgi:hypothetical protein